jgi:hypothetical protein
MNEMGPLKEILQRTGSLKCRISSDSMTPLLRVGAMVLVEPLGENGWEELRRFDLLVFHDGKDLMCHFLWTKNRLRTPVTLSTRSLKRCLVDDPPVTTEQILGVVRGTRLSLRHKMGVLFKNLIFRSA